MKRQSFGKAVGKFIITAGLAALLVSGGASLTHDASVAGDPSQWGVAGDPSQWGVAGDPSQWGVAGDPSQWGVAGDPSQWGY